MGRSPCCDKSKVKRGSWSPEEDATLRNYIHKHGNGGNWIALPRKAGLQRCGKSCRLRWLNYLRPEIKHGSFTEDEDYIICNLYNKIGSRWSVIASHLPGRTDNDVKNYWNTKLKKKLMAANCSNPPTRSDFKTTVAASNTAAAAPTAAVAASCATTASQFVDKTKIFQAPTNLLPSQDYSFPVPFQTDVTSVTNEPTNYNFPRLICGGSISNCSSANHSFHFSPAHQDSSHLSPFSLMMDENNGVKMDEDSFEVLSGIWSEGEAIEADSNADLFSFFHVDS